MEFFPSVAAPDLVLAAWSVIGLMIGVVGGQGIAPHIRSASVVVVVIAGCVSVMQIGIAGPAYAFAGAYTVTPLTALSRAVCFFAAAIVLLVSGRDMKRLGLDRYEFPILVTFAALGMGVMLSANGFVALFMGVETLGLASYVLASFDRENRRSAEAGLKYFVLGSLASGLFLYGVSLVYGFSGSLDFAQIARARASSGVQIGMMLVLAGLAFKAGAAPFHVWTPDVYQGAPTPAVALFATGAKFASVMVLARVMFEVFPSAMAVWSPIVGVMAALSMMIGSLGALMQSSLRRILAYSSIANVGFALVCVAVGPTQGGGALLVFMTLYVLGALGAFSCLIVLDLREAKGGAISDLNGLVRRRPVLAVCLACFVFSLAGVPPLAGFFGKWSVFRAALDAGLWWLAVVGVIASVVSLGYYLRLVWAMFVEDQDVGSGHADIADRPAMLVVGLLALALFPILVVRIGPFVGIAEAVGGGGVFR